MKTGGRMDLSHEVWFANSDIQHRTIYYTLVRIQITDQREGSSPWGVHRAERPALARERSG